jgi:hypothetical protein
MPVGRRKKYYVDRILQKRLFIQFAGINALIVGSSFLLFFLSMRGQIERHLYSSHIRLVRLTDLISPESLLLNAALAAASILGMAFVYRRFRRRLKRFFTSVEAAVSQRRGGAAPPTPESVSFSREFQDIDSVFEKFFATFDHEVRQDREKIDALKTKVIRIRQESRGVFS